MKTMMLNAIKTILIFAMLLFLAIAAHGQTLGVKMTAIDDLAAHIEVSDWNDKNIKLKIKNSIGVSLHQSVLTKSGNIHKSTLDFTLLPNGEYTAEVIGTEYSVVTPFFIENKRIYIENEEDTETASIRFKDKKITISYLNATRQPIEVKITDSNGQTVYKDHNSKQFNFQKRYDMSNLRAGIYTVTLKSGRDVYTEMLTLKP